MSAGKTRILFLLSLGFLEVYGLGTHNKTTNAERRLNTNVAWQHIARILYHFHVAPCRVHGCIYLHGSNIEATYHLHVVLMSCSAVRIGPYYRKIPTPSPNATRPLFSDQCDLRPLESRISGLENHFEEKFNALTNEVRAEARHIDYQNKDILKGVGDCRNDIQRFMGRTRRDNLPQNLQTNQNLDEKLEDLSRKLELTIATLRLIDFDLETIKTNLSNVFSITNKIWEKIDTESNIQKIFNNPPNQFSLPLPADTNPKNCKEIKRKSPGSPSGIYLVQPDDSKSSFMVFCDMVVQDGGWLTIHSRYDGNQDFYLGWQDYKTGFGNIAGEFWLGLEKIYQLTGSKLNELLIETVDPDKIKSFAHYSYFSIGSEEEGYSLKVLGGYKGNAGDALGYQAGSKFSTKDKDQDSWNEGNCAQSHSGAWWYKTCDKSNLNGRYLPGRQPEQFLYQRMYWGGTTGAQIGLLEARMLIRPKEDTNALIMPDSA